MTSLGTPELHMGFHIFMIENDAKPDRQITFFLFVKVLLVGLLS
jgi:hypothetical protein